MADEKEQKEQQKQTGLLSGVLDALRAQANKDDGKSLEKAMRDLVDNQILDTKQTLTDIETSTSQLETLKVIAEVLVGIEGIMSLDRLDRQRHQAHSGKVQSSAANMVSPSGGGGSDKKGGGLADSGIVKKLGIAAAAKSMAGAAKGIAMMGLAIPAFFGGLMIGNAAIGFAEKNSDFADLNFGNIKKAAAGFASIITEMDDRSLLAIAGVIGISGYVGSKDPFGAAGSVATMGAAISAFLGGLIIGNTAIGLAIDAGADLEFNSLKKAFAGFSSIITEMDKTALIALAGVIGLAGYGGTKGKKPTDVAVAIAATGAGIVGFLGGFVLGETVLTALGMSSGKYLSLDFPGLTKMFGGFNNMITKLSPSSIIALGGVIAAGTLIAKTGGANPFKLAGSMTGIGLGIVGLLGGFALGDAVLQTLGLGGDQNYDFAAIKNMLGGFNDIIASVDPPALIALGGAIVAAVALSKSGTSGTTFATNMTFIGLGVAGLLGGFMLGEVAVGYGLSKLGGADFPAITDAVKGFNSVMAAMSDETKVAIGVASGIAAFIAAKGDFTDGPKFALAMTMVGAGIGGLLAGFSAGEYAVTLLGEIDFTKLTSATKGFNDVVDELSVKGLAAFGTMIGLGALITKSFSAKDIVTFGLTMTGIGVGIGGFFAGFATGAYALDKLGEIDYGGIQEGIKQFGIAVDNLGDKGLVAFAGLLGTAGVLTAVLNFGVLLLPAAMGAMGAGIAAFIGGFDGVGELIAKSGLDGSGIAHLMGSLAKGIAEFDDIDGANMESLGKGLLAIGPGFAMLLGAKGLGVLADAGGALVDGIKGFFGLKSEEDNGGLVGQIMSIIGDPDQLDDESMEKLDKVIKTISAQDTSGFKAGVKDIAEGMAILTEDKRGFLEKGWDKLTGAGNPLQFLFELADKNREITYVGNGMKNLANGMEKINELGEYKMPDGFDLFIMNLNRQTGALNSGKRAINGYIQALDDLYATGNVVGGGSEAVIGTMEMQNRQEILETNRGATSGGGNNTVVAPTTNTSVNSVTNNNSISYGAPPPTDRHDEMFIFRNSGSPR